MPLELVPTARTMTLGGTRGGSSPFSSLHFSCSTPSPEGIGQGHILCRAAQCLNQAQPVSSVTSTRSLASECAPSDSGKGPDERKTHDGSNTRPSKVAKHRENFWGEAGALDGRLPAMPAARALYSLAPNVDSQTAGISLNGPYACPWNVPLCSTHSIEMAQRSTFCRQFGILVLRGSIVPPGKRNCACRSYSVHARPVRPHPQSVNPPIIFKAKLSVGCFEVSWLQIATSPESRKSSDEICHTFRLQKGASRPVVYMPACTHACIHLPSHPSI